MFCIIRYFYCCAWVRLSTPPSKLPTTYLASYVTLCLLWVLMLIVVTVLCCTVLIYLCMHLFPTSHALSFLSFFVLCIWTFKFHVDSIPSCQIQQEKRRNKRRKQRGWEKREQKGKKKKAKAKDKMQVESELNPQGKWQMRKKHQATPTKSMQPVSRAFLVRNRQRGKSKKGEQNNWRYSLAFLFSIFIELEPGSKMPWMRCEWDEMKWETKVCKQGCMHGKCKKHAQISRLTWA